MSVNETSTSEDQFQPTLNLLPMLTEEEAFIQEMEDRWHQNQRVLRKPQSEYDGMAIQIMKKFKVPCFKKWEELDISPNMGITPRTERTINVICRAMGLFAKFDHSGIRISSDIYYIQNKQLYIKLTSRTLGSGLENK